jgi:hypothetical protein
LKSYINKQYKFGFWGKDDDAILPARKNIKKNWKGDDVQRKKERKHLKGRRWGVSSWVVSA